MGKNKYIETPEKLWEIFEAYRKEVKDNPRIKVEYVGRNGDRVNTPIERPLSMDGFYCFGYDKEVTIHHYVDNPEGAYDEYRGIITRIRKEVRSEQIDGAMVNHYNSNLTARLNGLTEKQDIALKTQVSPFTSFDLDVSEDNGSS
tara:strand:+ start:848 stop:1282 length:435 start_codon:yes stop_codon:yes gene_type:complete